MHQHIRCNFHFNLEEHDKIILKLRSHRMSNDGQNIISSLEISYIMKGF